MEVIGLGLLGLGTVGGGLVNLIKENQALITQRTGCTISIKTALLRDMSKPRICDTGGIDLTQDANEVISRGDVNLIVELIGGTTTARELVIAALKSGKNVVTANKALIAEYGNELFTIAEENNVNLFFEASVAGGIPVIKALREGLAGNRIEQIAGIINGTGNFILTKMRNEKLRFEDVLKEAQDLGYAEADPTFDVEGIDAAHKLCILSAIAFGTPLQFGRAYTEGISRITSADIEYAEQLGYSIKHLGVAKRSGESLEMRVHPALIPHDRLISKVDGVMNAVVVQGNAVGETLLYGAGAGDLPTASAVMADIIDAIRTEGRSEVPALGVRSTRLKDREILPIGQTVSSFYLHFTVKDKTGVLAQITSALGSHGVSIDSVSQKDATDSKDAVPLIIITQDTQESNVVAALEEIEALDAVCDNTMLIRVIR